MSGENELARRTTVAKKTYPQRLKTLGTYLGKHGYKLGGAESIDGEGDLSVWDTRGTSPRIIANSDDLVSNYVKSRQSTTDFYDLLTIEASDPRGLPILEKEILSAASDLTKHSWRIGDALNQYSQILDTMKEPSTNVALLTRTAAFFTSDLRHDGIAFEAYNEARTRNASPANTEKRDAEQLAALVKENPSVDAIKKVLPTTATESILSHDLRLTVVATEKDGATTYAAKVLIDRKDKLNNSDVWTKALIVEAIAKLKELAQLVVIDATDPTPPVLDAAPPVAPADEGGGVNDEKPVAAI